MKGENKKVLFIINKFSGAGYKSSVEGRIIDTCRSANLECTIEYTASPKHATELAREALAKKYQAVFAVGGDGTVNEVAQGLLGGSIPMGILPKGSGNGLARHLGIPPSIGKAVSLISSNRTIAMDAILINGYLSVNVSGAGFDGHVAKLFSKNKKRGLVTYLKLVVSQYLAFREFTASITANGETYSRQAFMISFANSSQFGNNARISPTASVCDQQLDVCIIRKIPLWKIVHFTYALFSGKRVSSPYVEVIKTKAARVHFENPIPYHVDGEAMSTVADLEIQLSPDKLPVLIPANKNTV